jgi:hypothetical protein
VPARKKRRKRGGKQGGKTTGSRASARSSGFDVKKGHQSIWTGVLGALFVLGLFWGYAGYRIYELPDGGPMVGELFSYLPRSFRFRDVGREFLDILIMVGLLFQFMATWELLRGSGAAAHARAACVVAAASGVIAVWTCPPFVTAAGPYAVSSVEVAFAGIFAALLGLGGLGLWLQRRSVPGEAEGEASTIPPVSWRRALQSGLFRWGAMELLFTAAWLVYVRSPDFVNLPTPSFQNWRITVTLLWSLFSVFGLPYAVWTVRVRRRRAHDFLDPGLMLCLVYRSFFRAVRQGRARPLRFLRNRRVRSAMLDLLVKAFFCPVMVTFLFIEAGNFMNHLAQIVDMTRGQGWGRFAHTIGMLAHLGSMDPYSADVFFKTLYLMLRDSLFVIDVSVGLIGYACSFWWLRNKSKSVEPTFLGWIVTLACYPPLRILTTEILPITYNPGPAWGTLQLASVQNALLVVALVGNAIYVWATLAFGLRFSNLTHRGIITTGPYRFVRHPAYAAKVVALWCETAPVFGTLLQMLFFLGWMAIYYLRAVTEERHLRADPDYLLYCRAVKHRFVPGLW